MDERNFIKLDRELECPMLQPIKPIDWRMAVDVARWTVCTVCIGRALSAG